MEVIKFMFSGFWIFLGFLILLSGLSSFILILYQRTLRYWSMKKLGYPPIHCDADGDFKPEHEVEE
jgi:uncharacterized membrane protein YccF (DUF307 family)